MCTDYTVKRHVTTLVDPPNILPRKAKKVLASQMGQDIGKYDPEAPMPKDAEAEQARIEAEAAQQSIAQRNMRRRRRRGSVLASGAEGEDVGLTPAAIALDTLGGG